MSQGTAYAWPRPPCCPRCAGRRLWGHGYVSRYFDGFVEPLPMKRWRCPECGAVHTMRPSSHWRGFWAEAALILVSLRGKIGGRHWIAQVSRQRQQYWWHGYQRQRLFKGAPLSLPELLERQIILATHSLRFRCQQSLPFDPHRIFAVTARLPMS